MPVTHIEYLQLKKIGNYQQTFYVKTKNYGKNVNIESTLTLESLYLIL